MPTHPELKLQMVINKEMEMMRSQGPDLTAEVVMLREETDHTSQEEEAAEVVEEEVAVVVMLPLKMSVMRILETSRMTQNKPTRDHTEETLVVVAIEVAVDLTELVPAEMVTQTMS